MDEKNLSQRILISFNQYFRKKSQEREFAIDPQNHRIDKSNGLIKNFLRLTNKTLIGFQRVRLNKAAMLSGVLGLLTGYLFFEIDQKVTLLKERHFPAIRSILIKEVLQSKDLKNKLKQSLFQHVFTNPDIQYKLSQVLINEAIKPNIDDLFFLTKRAIIQVLQSQMVKEKGVEVASMALRQNSEVIGNLALEFLGGAKMDSIIRQKVSMLLGSEQVSKQISQQLKKLLKTDLNSDSTREKLYLSIRQKFINW